MQHDYFQLLIQSAQRGRKNAFVDLCELNAKKVYTLCVRMLANERLAKEITIQIFLQAWENIKFVRQDTSFDIWLKGIANYTILEEIRTKSKRTELNISGDDTASSDNKLENFILSLPERERIIFIMYQIEGYTFQEIADFLYEHSKDEIKSILRDTRRKIAEALKDEL